MTSPRAARIRALFDGAAELAGEDRRAYLARHCDGDLELLREVESLLCFDAADHPLATPLLAARIDALPYDDIDIPERIGAYRVLGPLGRGSSGLIFAAQRDHPPLRVAIKVLRRALLDDGDRIRFEREVEILARLAHRNVARVLDAGSFEHPFGARPFLVMELVNGIPPLDYAAAHGLDLFARLELIARIGDGVAHAHSRGVVHRDIKNGNVLVDAAGDPHVLDFGVARQLERSDPSVQLTRGGALVGTLACMSPEQASGDPARVDTRSDVYSLGVLAYELLSGRAPLSLDDDDLPTALRRVMEEEPPRLGSLDRRLVGDVEIVVAKALCKDPERRYQTVSELAADLRRIVAREPIAARPTRLSYTLAKFAARHRRAVAISGAMLLLLCASWIGTFGLLIRAQRQADVARARQGELRAALAQTERVTGFLEHLLTIPAPARIDADAPIEELLALWSDEVDQQLSQLPLLAARVHAALAAGNQQVGLARAARSHYAVALRLYTEQLGESHPTTLDTSLKLSRTLIPLGDPAAIGLAQRAVDVACVAIGPQQPLTLWARVRLGEALLGSGAGTPARAQLECALDGAAHLGAAGLRIVADCQGMLAWLALVAGQVGEAEARCRIGLAAHETLASPPADTLTLRLRLAEVVRAGGRGELARSLLESLDAEAVALYGEDHEITAEVRRTYVFLLAELAEFDAALALNERRLQALHHKAGANHRSTLLAELDQGRLLLEIGDAAAAERWLVAARDLASAAFAPDDPIVLEAIGRIAPLLMAQGRMAEAVATLEQARTQLAGGDNPTQHHVLAQWGLWQAAAMLQLGQDEAGLRLLRESTAATEAVWGPDHRVSLQASLTLAGACLDVDLDMVLARLRDTQPRATRVLGEHHPVTVVAGLLLGMVELFTGNAEASFERLATNVPRLSHPGVDPMIASRAILALREACTATGRQADGETILAALRQAVERLAADDPRRALLLRAVDAPGEP